MDNMKIGNFLSERRKLLGLTQQQLADKLGVSNKAISKWETGEGYPEITTIPDLCYILSISTDEFFEGKVLGVCHNKNFNDCIGNNDNPCNNKGVSDSNFMKISAFSRESKPLKFLRKEIKLMIPYFISLIFLYYILPILWNEFFESDYIYLSAFLVGCIICGVMYTIKYKFSFILGLGAGLLFLPTMALYMDGRDHDAIMFSVLYCITVIFASLMTSFLKARYSVSIRLTTKNN